MYCVLAFNCAVVVAVYGPFDSFESADTWRKDCADLDLTAVFKVQQAL